ncbi:MAG: AAA family ATPase [Candidatus Moranbacteria bacterium]|nr:AAA family ATPase [Candidatus Moranbacteria bacterium]
MKIKSIKEIKNIGTFTNFTNGSSFRFEKLTFVYGYNTFGKTTLTDIFQSLKDNNSEIITSRKTIPSINQNQKVKLSIKEDNEENNVIFQNGNWSQNNIQENLEIFGTDFIHKNLFTGFSIERENKVNFTEFILGESGVGIAEKIANDKKDLRDKTKELKNKIPAFVKEEQNKETIRKFIEFDISSLDKDKIVSDLIKKKKERQDEERILKEPQKILSLSNIENYSFSKTQILNYLQSINNLLQKDYSNIKDAVLAKINNHIENNLNKNDSAENWIKQGLNNCKDKESGNCVFCGQNLQNAKELINAYDSYFDEEYNKFIIDIEDELDSEIENIKDTNFSQENNLKTILNIVSKFKELIKNKDFQDNLVKLEEKIQILEEEKLNESKNIILELFKNFSELKNKKPYKKVEEIDFQEFSEKVKTYEYFLDEIKEILKNLKNSIESFKNLYKDTKNIQEKISKLEKEILDLEYKKARIEQDKDCKECIKGNVEIKELAETIQKQERKLQEDQSQYLDNYFEKINELFKKFGSHNFLLEKENDSRGDMPVYSLKIKFHNQEISDNDLQTVFSESDRRALSLSVFWAKVDLKSEEEKRKTIIILDDPITSFDDKRITNSIKLFKESLSDLGQIIIFTHYPNFIRNFCEKTKEKQITTKFFRIQKNNETSFLENQNRKEFTDSKYEEIFSKIYGFVNREHNNCIKSNLRPFLESLYLPTIFAKEIKKAEENNKDISSLEKLIDEIFSEENIKTKFHNFRKDLNSDSHIFTSNDEEDVRNFAIEMMDFLYSFEFEK